MRNLEFLFAIFENKISSGLIIMIDKRKWHVDFCLVSLAFYLLSVTCGLNANILVDFSVKNTQNIFTHSWALLQLISFRKAVKLAIKNNVNNNQSK